MEGGGAEAEEEGAPSEAAPEDAASEHSSTGGFGATVLSMLGGGTARSAAAEPGAEQRELHGE